MPKVIEIDSEEINTLKRRGLSITRISIYFGVSKATIKRKLKKNDPEKNESDREVLSFAAKLQKLVREVPNDYCRKEMNRLINDFRITQAASSEVKIARILEAVGTGAREIEQIAEEARLSESETLRLLDELIEKQRIVKRARGGVLNRGRKTLYHYYPLSDP